MNSLFHYRKRFYICDVYWLQKNMKAGVMAFMLPMHSMQQLFRTALLISATVSLFALTSCAEDPLRVGDVVKGAPLVVVTVNGPITYYEDAQGNAAGFEFELAKAFAQDIGVEVKFLTVPTVKDIDTVLEKGHAHIAAAGLPAIEKTATKNVNELPEFTTGPPFHSAQSILIYRKVDGKPISLEQMVGVKIAVIADSQADLNLAGHRNRDQTASDGFQLIRLPAGASGDELIQRVISQVTDYALIDSSTFDANKQLYPQLEKAYSVGMRYRYAWRYGKQSQEFLLRHSETFFSKLSTSGTLARLLNKHFGVNQRLSDIDLATFVDRIQTTLPKYRQHFLEAQQVSGIDWKLLAAIGYQESHWNPLAISPTGVRGLMMLTADTADRMKVADRTDARQSIIGGARYFALMRDSVALRIGEPDRTWFALAAYNQGLGHMEAARILAQRAKLSPDVWENVAKEMPRLADPSVYATLKTGYARGGEAVKFAENVRNFYDILSRAEAKKNQSKAQTQDQTKAVENISKDATISALQ
jgi:membrane-bound lytic murein transglycosylase F